MSDSSPKPAAVPIRRALILFIGTAVVALVLDLGGKSIAFARVAGIPVTPVRDASGALERIPHHEPVQVVPSVLSMHLTCNEGAVFGVGQGGRWFFIPFSLLAVGVLGWIFWTSDRRAHVLHVALGLVLAGALGNLYDRLAFGAVRDFLWLFPDVKLPFGWQWPGGSDELYPWIFNIADVALVVGVILLIAILFKGERQSAAASETIRATS